MRRRWTLRVYQVPDADASFATAVCRTHAHAWASTWVSKLQSCLENALTQFTPRKKSNAAQQLMHATTSATSKLRELYRLPASFLSEFRDGTVYRLQPMHAMHIAGAVYRLHFLTVQRAVPFTGFFFLSSWYSLLASTHICLPASFLMSSESGTVYRLLFF